MGKSTFSLSVFSFLLLSLAGCGQNNSVPNAIVKQVHTAVQIPKTSDIQSLNISSDGAASIWMVPNDPIATATQVLNWLKTTEPVSVHLPQSKSKKQWKTSAYTGPSILYLRLKDKELITIAPAYYIWVTNSGFTYHYLDGVITYEHGNEKSYLKAPELYQWLKKDQWKPQFKFQTG